MSRSIEEIKNEIDKLEKELIHAKLGAIQLKVGDYVEIVLNPDAYCPYLIGKVKRLEKTGVYIKTIGVDIDCEICQDSDDFFNITDTRISLITKEDFMERFKAIFEKVKYEYELN